MNFILARDGRVGTCALDLMFGHRAPGNMSTTPYRRVVQAFIKAARVRPPVMWEETPKKTKMPVASAPMTFNLIFPEVVVRGNMPSLWDLTA